MTREELVNSREYKIASAALNDISNIDEEYADNEDYIGGYVDGFESGAEWSDETTQNHWHDAQGDDLPPIDKEVIVLLDNGKVCFAHRPKEYWDGKNIATGEVTRYYPKRYDKGGWNIPDVKWWCDIDLPEKGGEE